MKTQTIIFLILLYSSTIFAGEGGISGGSSVNKGTESGEIGVIYYEGRGKNSGSGGNDSGGSVLSQRKGGNGSQNSGFASLNAGVRLGDGGPVVKVAGDSDIGGGGFKQRGEGGGF